MTADEIETLNVKIGAFLDFETKRGRYRDINFYENAEDMKDAEKCLVRKQIKIYRALLKIVTGGKKAETSHRAVAFGMFVDAWKISN